MRALWRARLGAARALVRALAVAHGLGEAQLAVLQRSGYMGGSSGGRFMLWQREATPMQMATLTAWLGAVRGGTEETAQLELLDVAGPPSVGGGSSGDAKAGKTGAASCSACPHCGAKLRYRQGVALACFTCRR